MALSLGMHTLLKASHNNCFYCIENLVCNSSWTYIRGLRLVYSSRGKSTAALLTTGAVSDGEDPGGGRSSLEKKVYAATKYSTEYSKNVKIMLTEKSSKLKSLVSYEPPMLHHAKARAVVDVKTTDPPSPNHYPTPHSIRELLVPVEQLLKDSQNSVQENKMESDEEDLDYVEKPEEQQLKKTKLIGALPPGALDWRPQKLELHKLGYYYADLSKSRLTGLVVITAVAGYAMAPGPFDPLVLLVCSLGTGLTSSAANTINQYFEVPFDSQMSRTQNRILVRGLVSPLHAVCFASVCGSLGITMLYFGANGMAASLGALNLLLYTCVYTPMKRLSIFNTWVGSIVGAIPPLIGWTSCTGELEAGAWIMAGILFAWQFPHFNALSWNLRPDYSRAGYRMMCVTNPGLCRRVALRYSLAMIGLCTLAPVMDITTWMFAVDSLPVNLYLTYLSWRFYKDADSKSSRKLFFYTLIHLPLIMMFMIMSKKHYNKSIQQSAIAD